MKTYMNCNPNLGYQTFMRYCGIVVLLAIGGNVAWSETLTLDNIVYELNEKTKTAEVIRICDKGMVETEISQEFTIFSGTYFVTGIAPKCFEDCKKLETVFIPRYTKIIGDECFKGCSSLKSVKIPSDVERLGKLCFADCSQLSEVVIDTEKLEGIPEGCFSGCTNLSQMTIRMNTPPARVLSTTGHDQFAGAGPMNYLYVPQGCEDAYRESDLWKGWENILPFDFEAMDEYDKKKLVDLGNGKYFSHENGFSYSLDHERLTATFLGLNSTYFVPSGGKVDNPNSFVVKVDIPDYVLFGQKLYTVTRLGNNCLSDYMNLSSVRYPSALKELGDGCFQFSGTAYVNLPEGVEKLGAYCFGSSDVFYVDLPSSLSTIGKGCFSSCNYLRRVIIRSGDLKTVSEKCFANSWQLSELVCYANEIPELEYDGDKSPFYMTNAKEGKLYVQKDLVEAYKATPGWNEWKDILPIDAYGSANGIENVKDGKAVDAAIYDLQGRKVQTPQRGGLYIQGGRKFIYR